MTKLQSGSHYQDQTFHALDLDRAHVEDSTFLDCQFERCSFVTAHLFSCRFQRCSFVGCDLSLVEVDDTVFGSAYFEESKLIGIDWTKALSSQPSLGKPLSFSGSILNHGTFIGQQLQGILVIDCIAHEVDFRESDLSNASFSSTDLKDSLFLDTNLSAADLRTARNYHIDATKNTITDAKFSLPEAMLLLDALEIELDESSHEP